MESKQNANQIRMSEAKDDWKPLRKMASQPADKYRIGEIGDPWGVAEKKEWLDQTTKKRSYLEEVVTKYVKIDMNVFEVTRCLELKEDGPPCYKACRGSFVHSQAGDSCLVPHDSRLTTHDL